MTSICSTFAKALLALRMIKRLTCYDSSTIPENSDNTKATQAVAHIIDPGHPLKHYSRTSHTHGLS